METGIRRPVLMWLLLGWNEALGTDAQSWNADAFGDPRRKVSTKPVLSTTDCADLPFYDLMIVIPTHGQKDIERRSAIRSSWEQYPQSSKCEACQKRKVKVLFVAGQEGDAKEMAAEAEQFGDLAVLPDFGQFEFYTHRAEKTQRSMRYALEHYRFKLLMKANTDAWVFTDRLLDFLDGRGLFERADDGPEIYAGNFALGTGAHPDNNAQAKWYDPVYEAVTGLGVYPKHAKGAAYVLSPDLVEYIAEMGAATDRNRAVSLVQGGEVVHGWAHMPKLEDLPCEDVSMGFWLQAVNHTKVQLPLSIGNTACTSDTAVGLVVDHYVTPEDMRRRWSSYVASGDPCGSDGGMLRGFIGKAQGVGALLLGSGGVG